MVPHIIATRPLQLTPEQKTAVGVAQPLSFTPSKRNGFDCYLYNQSAKQRLRARRPRDLHTRLATHRALSLPLYRSLLGIVRASMRQNLWQNQIQQHPPQSAAQPESVVV